MQRCHQDRRAHTVPTYVTNDRHKSTVLEEEEVEVVARSVLGRVASSRNVEAGNLRRHLRQKMRLDFLRCDQLCELNAKPLLHLLPVRDVEVRAGHSTRLPGSVVDNGPACQDPAIRAILMAQSVL